MVAIPVELMLGGVQLTEPRLDPSGRRLAWIESTSDTSGFVVVEFDGAGSPGPPTRWSPEPAPAPGRGLGGGSFDWLPAGDGVVYVGTDDALWIATLDDRVARCLWRPSSDTTPGAAAAASFAQAPAVSPDGTRVAFMLDQRHIVLRPLAPERADEPDTVLAQDAGYEFRFDPVFSPDSRQVVFQGWSPPDMAWDAACRVTVWVDSPDEVVIWCPPGAAVQQPGFAPDGLPTAATDATGWLTVWRGEAPVIANEKVEHASPTWGPRQRSYAVSPDGRHVAVTRNEAGFGRLVVVAIDTGEWVELGRGVHGQVTWRGERITALRTGARTPTEIVEYSPDDVGSWRRRQIASGADDQWSTPVVRVHLVEPEPFDVPDGAATLYGRRYRSAEPADRTIVWIHGGPTAQWEVSFRPDIAYWGSRGWDVLVVDPRGSSGHGRNYQQALHGGWGVLDVDDTAVITENSHRNGWSTPPRTVVMGGSSGGLTVLGTLARHDELVAGGVAVYPVSDLFDLSEHSHRFEQHYSLTLVGPLDDVDRYAARSPQHYAGDIGGPLLLMHGTDDAVVPVEQSIALAGRIRSGGGTVELHLFDGEGHGFRHPESKRRELALTESFLDRTVPR